MLRPKKRPMKHGPLLQLNPLLHSNKERRAQSPSASITRTRALKVMRRSHRASPWCHRTTLVRTPMTYNNQGKRTTLSRRQPNPIALRRRWTVRLRLLNGIEEAERMSHRSNESHRDLGRDASCRHASSASLPKGLPAIWTVPLSRNLYFGGRESEPTALQTAFADFEQSPTTPPLVDR
jgi:hypothetical protein